MKVRMRQHLFIIYHLSLIIEDSSDVSISSDLAGRMEDTPLASLSLTHVHYVRFLVSLRCSNSPGVAIR